MFQKPRCITRLLKFVAFLYQSATLQLIKRGDAAFVSRAKVSVLNSLN